MKKTFALVALAGLIVALLAACGGSKDHNDADITFAQQMVPHHEQAIVMADQALKTSKDSDVLALAKQIKAAQGPEIKSMNAWLKKWDATGNDHGDMAGMDHSDTGMGMMSDDEMMSLDNAAGKKFDTQWLTLMIKHHQGAVAMAKTERADGEYPAAKKLAAAVIKGQEAEITTMKGLMGS